MFGLWSRIDITIKNIPGKRQQSEVLLSDNCLKMGKITTIIKPTKVG